MPGPADRRLNVLIVDDDAIVRQAIERDLLNEPSLQARGVRATRASDGKRALGLLKKELPDIVLVDLLMPRMDGFELARAIRTSEDTAQLPIILLSGVAGDDAQVAALCREVGAVFVTKPAPPAALAQAILNAVDRAHDAAANATPPPARALTRPGIPPSAAAAPPRHPTTPEHWGKPTTGTYGSPRGPAPTLVPAVPAGLDASGTFSGAAQASVDTRTGLAPRRHGTVLGVPVPEDSGSLPIVNPTPAEGSPIAPAAARAGAPPLRGSLADRSVARLLLEHLAARSTGRLLVQRGQMKKEIFLHDGKPVGAGSNLRQEALGSLLVSRGVIDEEQLTLLLGEMKRSGDKMGAVLVQLGWLTPEDVLRFLGAQARKRIVDCLRFPEGTYEFVPGGEFLEREIEHELDAPKLYFAGLQKTATPDRLVERLVDKHGAHAAVPTLLWDTFRDVFEEVFGADSVRLIRTRPVIGTVALGPESSASLVAIEAAALCGMIELRSTAGRDTGPVPTPESAAKSSMSLERLGARHLSSQLGADAQPKLDLDLDPDRGVRAAAEAPLDDPSDGAAPIQALSMEDSGVVNVDALSIHPAAAPNDAAPGSGGRAGDAHAVVLNEYLAIFGKNLYQILGVERDVGMDDLVVAYEAKTRKFAPDVFSAAELGADAAKLDSIRQTYNRAFKILSHRKEREIYDRSLQSAREGGDVLGAELTFAEARQMVENGQAEDALPKLEAAVRAAPDEPAYHAHMGRALYLARGPGAAAAARQHLQHALSLDPDNVDAHDFLGQLAAATGDADTARTALDRALELDPRRVHCLRALLPLFAENSEFHETERIYRRLIQALGDRHLPLRQLLWKELAELYEHEFDDQASARIAYEMAARLSPDDVELQRKVVALNAHDLDRWKDIARALTAEWRVRPYDAELGSALCDLFLRVGKNDAATIVAAALVLRGLATPEHRSLADRSAPRLLTRLSQTIEGSVLQRARHAGEDTEIEFLFATLASQGILPPFSDAEVGLLGDRPLGLDEQPEVFTRVLDYVSGVLGVRVPERVFAVEALDGDARLADTRPCALFVGPALLHSNDTVELGFRLGRAMSFGTPGRLTGAARSGRQLKPYLMACMAYARQALSAGEIEVVPIIERLDACEPQTRRRLKDLGARLARDRNTINLSAWAKALGRTASRLGLLISGDLLRVGRALAEEEGGSAVEDLLDFALSLEHFDLREELGISSVV